MLLIFITNFTINNKLEQIFHIKILITVIVIWPLFKVQMDFTIIYHIAGKFVGGVWRINSFRDFGNTMFGELIDRPIDY